jgi:hypothetical protein
VSEHALEDAPPIPTAATTDRSSTDRAGSALRLLRKYGWVIAAIALLLFSFGLLEWARTRPGYDPFGWLVWGYQSIHLHLNLGGAPSWKPLPLLLTFPFAIFGVHDELWLWMVASVAISLSGVFFTGRIAYRLIGVGDDGDRRPALIGAVFAGACLLGISDYMHIVLSVQSDPMIVTLFVAAWDAYLSGRPRLAFVLGCLGGIGRPEVWSSLAPFTVYLWIKRPDTRKLLIAGWLFILFMWFGIPTLTNGRPFIAYQLALRSPRAPKGNLIVASFHRYTGLTYLPTQLGALFALGIAWLRRDWRVLLVGAGAILWVLTETALDLKGLPGQPRYIFEPAALQLALSGVAVGWLLIEFKRATRLAIRVGAIALAAAAVLPMVPAAVARMRFEHRDLAHERDRTTDINQLQALMNHIGGAKRIDGCGHPVNNTEFASMTALFTHLNVGNVGYLPKRELYTKTYPIVLFIQLPDGWEAHLFRQKGAQKASCASMNAAWTVDSQHPGGVLTPSPH